jgi:4-amino-4-deoxy-L-arabinose transferase-like glycosyltransferase
MNMLRLTFFNKNFHISEKKLLLYVFLIACIFRILYGIVNFYIFGTEKWADDFDYLKYADYVLQQGPFVGELPVGPAEVGPVYPWIIAAVFSIFGKNYLAVIILNSIVSALIPVIIYYAAKIVFDVNVAFLSALWAIIYIPYYVELPFILKESWMQFLFILTVLLFFKSLSKKEGIKYLILTSIVFVFFIHMDERYFTFFPVFLLGYFFLNESKDSSRLIKPAFFLLIVAMLMVPWTIRNYNVYGRPIVLTERTAKFTDKLLGYPQDEHDFYEISPYSRKMIPLYESIRDSILAGYEIKSNVRFLKNMKEGISKGSIPRAYGTIENYFSEFIDLWAPAKFNDYYVANGFRYQKAWSTRNNVLFSLSYGILLPFLLISIVLIFKHKNSKGVFLLVLLVMQTIIHVFLAHARFRYRVPVDSVIIICSFYAIYEILKTFNFKFIKVKIDK